MATKRNRDDQRDSRSIGREDVAPKARALQETTSRSRASAKPPTAKGGLKERARRIHERLSEAEPAPKCELDFRNGFELLVATILSAQSTDRMVNQVAPEVFRRWPTPQALAGAAQEEVEAVVKRTGFFRNKAKSIRTAAQAIVEKHRGEVPRTMEELIELPGVARKTANVVLGTAYRITTGITVDTHVGRVARRLELTQEEDPTKVEQALMALFPREAWIDTGHRLLLHGRYVCTARASDCAHCPVNELCPSAAAKPEGPWPERAERERRRVESRGEAE